MTDHPETNGNQPLVDPEFVEILVCPACKSSVREEAGLLVCQNPECSLGYPIQDGIPVMLIEEARKPDA